MTSTAPAPQGGAHATRTALAWAHTARFFTTAAQLDQLPGHDLPEIAFVGRSNAGKSTAINTVAQQRQLAFASKTPGRTQHINLFAVGPREAPDALWADLPGYGYAAVERAAKLRWQKVMADYLAHRHALAGIVMIAQMAILAGVREHQGLLMGLFSTTSYLGMSLLPFIAGLCADMAGFFWAFSITAFFACLVALTIGRTQVPYKAP